MNQQLQLTERYKHIHIIQFVPCFRFFSQTNDTCFAVQIFIQLILNRKQTTLCLAEYNVRESSYNHKNPYISLSDYTNSVRQEQASIYLHLKDSASSRWQLAWCSNWSSSHRKVPQKEHWNTRPPSYTRHIKVTRLCRLLLQSLFHTRHEKP